MQKVKLVWLFGGILRLLPELSMTSILTTTELLQSSWFGKLSWQERESTATDLAPAGSLVELEMVRVGALVYSELFRGLAIVDEATICMGLLEFSNNVRGVMLPATP